MTTKIAPRKQPLTGTYRDDVAVAAMQGLVSRSMTDGHEDVIARQAYMLADAMLTEKAKAEELEPEPQD
jgi:hypothetical protein